MTTQALDTASKPTKSARQAQPATLRGPIVYLQTCLARGKGPSLGETGSLQSQRRPTSAPGTSIFLWRRDLFSSPRASSTSDFSVCALFGSLANSLTRCLTPLVRCGPSVSEAAPERRGLICVDHRGITGYHCLYTQYICRSRGIAPSKWGACVLRAFPEGRICC